MRVNIELTFIKWPDPPNSDNVASYLTIASIGSCLLTSSLCSLLVFVASKWAKQNQKSVIAVLKESYRLLSQTDMMILCFFLLSFIG